MMDFFTDEKDFADIDSELSMDSDSWIEAMLS